VLERFMNAVPEAIVQDVRRFNRFYTLKIGVLGAGWLDSDWTLTEARVLYEIAQARDAGLLASDLVKTLELDFGYLSRILARFDKRGWLKRERSTADARKSHLWLTAKGRKVFAELDRRAREEVTELLQPLGPPQQQKLQTCLRDVELLLNPGTKPADEITLRTHRPGDIGWIVQRHGALYAKEYGFNHEFEALVAEICAKFLREFDSSAERCWIAERGGVPVGTIMLVRGSPEVAKLRLLLVEDTARGLGVGGLLVRECVTFAREAGYRSMTLWTQSILVAARRLYEAAGFKCVRSEPHDSFGVPLTGETWTLDF
jgi:DNA-binding MarR family transcriptional regulator/GNAT superfamily N-acetyltransferase